MIIENFDDFYDHYQGFSAYVAFCITEDYELSKDISQEVFLALFKVKEKLDYSRPDKLKALVMKATSNKCMDYYRKASSRQESYTIDDEENVYAPVDEKSTLNENLSSITVKLPHENVSVPGVYYYIFQSLAWEGIIIDEVISTSNEFTIIVNENQIDLALSVIKDLKKIG